jgi:hypothetical protein
VTCSPDAIGLTRQLARLGASMHHVVPFPFST